ncbi:hypothetical protein BJ742DRAFT_686500 [Cladochytrium replicatum]|nr:hypothetical protein BJ742DRAFT_686500 [Cladochytrium replicatum]
MDLQKVHSPFPQEIANECSKSAEILNEFAMALSVDHPTIPPQAFAQAKGVAIFTVLKVGAGWSGKFGSGIVVARLPDGRWSAPSAVTLFGAGYGPQIGISMADIVVLITSDDHMNAFTQNGQLSVGAQFSLTAGDQGRSVDTAGLVAAPGTFKLAPSYTYAKTRGLFAGVSLEGAIIATRGDANERFYKEKSLTPAQLLVSALEPPAAAEPLYLALANVQSAASTALSNAATLLQQGHWPSPATTPSAPAIASISQGVVSNPPPPASIYPTLPGESLSSSSAPAPPVAPRPNDDGFPPIGIALYDYNAQRPTDLSFKKGDVIEIVTMSSTQNDWWLGRLNGKEGRFPANYIKTGSS